MKNKKNARLLCIMLTAAMLVQPMNVSAAGLMPGGEDAWPESQELTVQTEAQDEALTDAAEESEALPAQEQVLQAEAVSPALQSGAALIPAGSDENAVKLILAQALISNSDQFSEEELLGLEWEYYCEGKNGLLKNSAWGSVNGFVSKKVLTNYTHPALVDNGNGNYQIRLAGTAREVTLEKKDKLDSSIVLNEGVSVSLPYTEDSTIDYAQLEAKVFEAVVAETTPGLTLADVAVEYYATATTGSVGSMGKNWAPIQGGKISGLEYPGMSAGENQKIRFVWDGDSTHAGFYAETTITVTDREEAPYVKNDPIGSAKLPIREDLTVDYDAMEDAIFNAVVAESEVISADNATIEYYATAKSGSVGGLGKSWAPIQGGKISGLEYPGIPAGVQKIRISWPGSQVYAPTVIEADVEVKDREQVQFILNEAPYETGIVFTADQGYDYAATARAIYDTVVASVSQEVAYEDIRVEYNTDLTGLTNSYKPLDEKDLTGLVKFKDGTWKIRISCSDTVAYRGNSVTVEVTVSDNRIASAVAVKEGASFTYNMDTAVMKQAIFDNVIDWENSELPAKETLSMDDFEILYKAQIDVLDNSFDAGKLGGLLDKIPGLEGIGGSIDNIAGSLNDSTKRWMPIEGGKYLGIPYTAMGAGKHQVQISYKGNAEYRPSDGAEAAVTVKKANVKVSVKSANIYADQTLPENFITTNPADKFDFYTIYAGATSNVNLGLYLDLPEKFSNNKLMGIIDPIAEKITGKSFSKMLQDGVTLGELRKMFDSTELLELLDKVGVDTGAFGQILKVLNALPSITDSVRIGFGAPNRAGLYSATVITDNKNYNTGVGIGALLVRMRLSGVKLTWNQGLGSKISAADAKNFDFGATLSYDGDVSIVQDNVHYLYSGFTSKWKVYSSTTTPPTEPGRYVVTVVTLGGNYQAAPITRSFQITK